MRIFEILWSLQSGTLARGQITPALEGDAHLGARLIRSYARDWLDGLPYIPFLRDIGRQIERRGRSGPVCGRGAVMGDKLESAVSFAASNS